MPVGERSSLSPLTIGGRRSDRRALGASLALLHVRWGPVGAGVFLQWEVVIVCSYGASFV